MTQKALALQPNYTALVCLNTRFVAGTMMLVRTMEIGMKPIIVEPSSNPLENVDEDLTIDFMAVVPLQLQTMLAAGLDKRLNKMKVIIVGGAAIGQQLEAEIRRLVVPVYSTYGMTETVSHVALRQLNGKNKSQDYRLLDDIEARTDGRGCLALCGQVTNQEWVQTNDVIEWTTERTFKMVGRADNIINSGGIKIQLEKVEQKIGAIWPYSSRFFCWYEPDERLGQKLILVYEALDSELNKEKIKHSLSTVLTNYETPKKIVGVPIFIETPTGKIDKRQTLAQATAA